MSEQAFSLACHYYDLGQYGAALDALQSEPMIVDRVEDLPRQLLLLDIYSVQGKKHDARQLIERLLPCHPHDESVKQAFVAVSIVHKDLAVVGTEQCQQMLAVDAENYRLWQFLAQLGFAWRTIDDDLVFEAMVKAVELSGEDEATLLIAHLVFANLGHAEAAEHCVQRLASSSPDSADTYEAIAYHFVEAKRYRELAEICLDGLTVYPQNETLASLADVAVHQIYTSPIQRVATWPIEWITPAPTTVERWGPTFGHRLEYYAIKIRRAATSVLVPLIVWPLSIVLTLLMFGHFLQRDPHRRFLLNQTDELHRRLVGGNDISVFDEQSLLVVNDESFHHTALRIDRGQVAFVDKRKTAIDVLLSDKIKQLARKNGRYFKLKRVKRWEIRDNLVESVPGFFSSRTVRAKIALTEPSTIQQLVEWLTKHGYEQARSRPLPWWRLWGRATILMPVALFVASACFASATVLGVVLGFVILANLVDRLVHTFRYRPNLLVLSQVKSALDQKRQ